MEVREEFMVSPAGDSEPTLRTAHFLKPLANATIDGSSASLPPSPTLPSLPHTFFEPKEWPLAIHFIGWRYTRQDKWFHWVDTLYPKYESLWKKVGIFEAIMSTKFCIAKNKDLVFGVAEKWCPTTNTFVFPWGEATITLEDVMVLGGYPVLGDPVFAPLDNHEMKDVEEKLVVARKEPWRSRQAKCSTSAWMDMFINSGSEIEHEAFLAAWLSTFVFPSHNATVLVNKNVFPIAVHLARGNPIALAPAVLASIYKDLGLLKNTIVGLTKNALVVGDKEQLEVILESPFYLVQIWVWERFQNLQPQPNLFNNGDPMLSRWHKVNLKALKIDNVRLALDSAAEDFIWRPYVRYAGKCRLFYQESEFCAPVDTILDNNELVSIVRCLRVSELVGLGCFIEQYLPHRVAMQFGMDQDVPGCVARFNETQAIAWKNYCRPISDENLYFPSRLFEADVTMHYAMWWKQSVLGHQDPVKNIVQRKRSPRLSNHGLQASKANRSGNDANVPLGFPPKLVCTMISGKSCYDGSKTREGDYDAEVPPGSGKYCDDGSKTREGDYDADVPPGFLPKRLKTVTLGNYAQDGFRVNQNVDANVPTGLPPKLNTMNPSNSVENYEPVLEENEGGDMTYSLGKVTADECQHLSEQCSSSSAADSGAGRKILPPAKRVAKVNIELSIEGLEEDFEDANGSKESRLSSDMLSLSGTLGEGCSCASKLNLVELEQRISRLERVIGKL